MNKLVITAAAAAVLAMSGVASADQALAQKNACMSCHGVDKKIVGPAFKEIAAKYKGDAGAQASWSKRSRQAARVFGVRFRCRPARRSSLKMRTRSSPGFWA